MKKIHTSMLLWNNYTPLNVKKSLVFKNIRQYQADINWIRILERYQSSIVADGKDRRVQVAEKRVWQVGQWKSATELL